jgi:micrococcal nuclease
MASTTDKADKPNASIFEDCFHIYRAEVLRVLDGDTVEVMVDLGFGIQTKQRLRIYGVNSPEKDTEAGKAARQFVSETLYGASEVHIRTFKQSSQSDAEKREKYGRYLVQMIVDDQPLDLLIIKAGHGEVYFGGKRTFRIYKE